MSGPAEEKGGKSSKMPTLITPALAMSSSSSASAGPPPATWIASARSNPGMRAAHFDIGSFISTPWPTRAVGGETWLAKADARPGFAAWPGCHGENLVADPPGEEKKGKLIQARPLSSERRPIGLLPPGRGCPNGGRFHV